MSRLNLPAQGFLFLFLSIPVVTNDVADVTFHFGDSFGVQDRVWVQFAGDFTGDGHADIVTTDSIGRLNLLEGDGTGQFAEAKLLADLQVLLDWYGEVTDLNNDGALDLVLPVRNRILVLLGTGAGDFSPPMFYVASPTPLGLAVGDFNGDGMQDVASSNLTLGNVSLWFGDGSGGLNFQQNHPAGLIPTSLSAGDLNGDGALDLAVADSLSSSVTILLNDGSGSFSSGGNFATGLQPLHIVAADFNGDGNLDLATANSKSQSLSILLGRGDGTFDAAPDLPDWAPTFLATGDWNQDQIPDLASLNSENCGLRIYIGKGDGTFTLSNSYAVGVNHSLQMAAEDFNEDGLRDLVIGVDNSVTILSGKGNGDFQAAPLVFSGAKRARRAEVADLNGDGLNDLITIGSGWSIGVRLGNGGGEFERPQTYTISCEDDQDGVRDGFLTDLNVDGKTDIVALCSTGGIWSLLGNGDGTFQQPISSSAPFEVRRMGIGNFDPDPYPDVVCTAANATFLLLGKGDGTFHTPQAVAFPATSLAVADFSQDGTLDLALDYRNWDGPTDLVVTLLGDGTGQFTLGGARLIGYSCGFDSRAVGDFNEDGFPDLALVRTTVDNEPWSDRAVLLNDGSGGLHPPTFLGRSKNQALPVVGDFNNDGHIDIFTHGTSVQHYSLRTILLGRGDGTFAESNREFVVSGTFVTVGDVNQDGLSDLLMAGIGSFWVSFLINTTEINPLTK